MGKYNLDITGKVCPFCLLLVKKKLASMTNGESLVVILDHPPAATDTIPYNILKMGYKLETDEIEPGLWELTIIKQ